MENGEGGQQAGGNYGLPWINVRLLQGHPLGLIIINKS